MRHKNPNLLTSKVPSRLRVLGVMDKARKYGIMTLCICHNMYFETCRSWKCVAVTQWKKYKGKGKDNTSNVTTLSCVKMVGNSHGIAVPMVPTTIPSVAPMITSDFRSILAYRQQRKTEMLLEVKARRRYTNGILSWVYFHQQRAYFRQIAIDSE